MKWNEETCYPLVQRSTNTWHWTASAIGSISDLGCQPETLCACANTFFHSEVISLQTAASQMAILPAILSLSCKICVGNANRPPTYSKKVPCTVTHVYILLRHFTSAFVIRPFHPSKHWIRENACPCSIFPAQQRCDQSSVSLKKRAKALFGNCLSKIRSYHGTLHLPFLRSLQSAAAGFQAAAPTQRCCQG